MGLKKAWKSLNINPHIGYHNAYPKIFNKSNAQIIIDSSKDYSHLKKIEKTCEANEFILNVVITFRPFAKILESDLRRKKNEKNIIDNISRYINIKNKIIDKNYKYVIVNIENLILNPRKMTKVLCDSVEIPYFEGKEDYWNFPSCHLYGSRTQRQHLKNPKNAKYDRNKVFSKPKINHPFLKREDITATEEFFVRNALKCE